MSMVNLEQVPAPKEVARSRFNRWDSPWLNPKLIAGFVLVMFVVLMLMGPGALSLDALIARRLRLSYAPSAA